MECDAGIADGRTPGAVLAEKLFGLDEKGKPSMRANVKVGDLTLPYRWVDIDHPGSFSTDSTNSVFTGDVKLTLDMRPSEVTVETPFSDRFRLCRRPKFDMPIYPAR